MILNFPNRVLAISCKPRASGDDPDVPAENFERRS